MEFQEKTISVEFFGNFVQTKAILYRNLWNFAVLLFWVRLALKRFTEVLPYVVCTQVSRHIHKRITKRRYGMKKPRTICLRKSSFVHSRSRTYYALLLGCFGQKFLPDIRHCVYWVLAEVWGLDLSHKIGNKFFINHSQGWKEGSFVCETVWFSSWANSHPFDLKFVVFCPKLSGDSYVEFQEKTISENFFGNFVQTKAFLNRNLWNFALLSAIFILGPCCAKKVHRSTSICCLHLGKDARP